MLCSSSFLSAVAKSMIFSLVITATRKLESSGLATVSVRLTEVKLG